MTTMTVSDSPPAADVQVRRIHAVLTTQLGLPSPLAEAVAVLDRAAQQLQVDHQLGVQRALVERQHIARQVALGELTFDAALADFERTSRWVVDRMTAEALAAASLSVVATTPAEALAAEVDLQARAEAGQLLTRHVGAIFDTVRDEARRQIEAIEALPAPPQGLWASPDAGRLLARTRSNSPHDGPCGNRAVVDNGLASSPATQRVGALTARVAP